MWEIVREIGNVFVGFWTIVRWVLRFFLTNKYLPPGAGMVAPIIYAAVVAIGVPLMGWLVHNTMLKLVITVVWLFLAPGYFWFAEVHELNADVERTGLLDPEKVNRQIKRLQFLYWGAAIAFFVWVWVGTIKGVLELAGISSPIDAPVYTVEWVILASTIKEGTKAIDAIGKVLLEFLQAQSGQRRVDVADQLAESSRVWRWLAR